MKYNLASNSAVATHAARILPHDPAWPVQAARLADQLKTVLDEEA